MGSNPIAMDIVFNFDIEKKPPNLFTLFEKWGTFSSTTTLLLETIEKHNKQSHTNYTDIYAKSQSGLQISHILLIFKILS